MLDLRPYQHEALAAIEAAGARGVQRSIAQLATGLGKTVIFAHLLRQRGGRAVVLAHRDELVRQAAAKIRAIYPESRVGIVKAEEDEVHADVVVASVQTLARPARLERLVRASAGSSLLREIHPRRFSTVVVDEVHHYVGGDDGNTFGRVLVGLGCMDEGGPLTAGFTATPERTTGALGGTWQEIVFSMGILEGIAQGFLTEIRAKQVKLRADFSRLHVRAGEFRDEESAELLMEADAPGHAARAYLEHAPGERAIVFTPTVAVAHAMAQAFRAAGVPAEAVDGTMAMEGRRAILARLHSGETKVVPNAQVLTEGFDEPAVSCIIMARPTRSRPFAIQCIGRGTRLYPGKERCLVLDLVGSATRMDLVTVASLFDVTPEAAERGIARAVSEKAHAAAEEAAAAEVQAGRLVTVDVDIFKARDFAWVLADSPAGQRFVLSLGHEGNLVLQPGPEADTWEVYQVRRQNVAEPGAKWPKWAEDRRKLYTGLPLDYAQGAAEDYMRKVGAVALNNRDAAWRKLPASEAQRKALMRTKRWREGMTKGEASDAITAQRMAR
jgi:ATP-dependent helicase IRC3